MFIFKTLSIVIVMGGVSSMISSHGCHPDNDKKGNINCSLGIVNVIDSSGLVPVVKRYNYKINDTSLDEPLIRNVRVEFDNYILFDPNFRRLYRVKKVIKPRNELSFLLGSYILISETRGQIREAAKNIRCGWCYNYTIKGDLYYLREKKIKECCDEYYEGYCLVVNSVRIDSVRG